MICCCCDDDDDARILRIYNPRHNSTCQIKRTKRVCVSKNIISLGTWRYTYIQLHFYDRIHFLFYKICKTINQNHLLQWNLVSLYAAIAYEEYYLRYTLYCLLSIFNFHLCHGIARYLPSSLLSCLCKIGPQNVCGWNQILIDSCISTINFKYTLTPNKNI